MNEGTYEFQHVDLVNDECCCHARDSLFTIAAHQSFMYRTFSMYPFLETSKHRVDAICVGSLSIMRWEIDKNSLPTLYLIHE